MMALVKSCADNECLQPDIQAEILFFKGLVQYFKNNGRQSLAEFKKAADIIPDKKELQALKSEITFWTSLARHLTGKNELQSWKTLLIRRIKIINHRFHKRHLRWAFCIWLMVTDGPP